MAEKFSFNKERYIKFAREMANKYGLPQDLFLGQLDQESNWNPKATSRTGARGIGQFQERWHPVGSWKFKTKEDYYDPYKSIESAAMYMSSLKKQYNGNYMAALAHYNGGTRQGQLVASGQNPNVPETANYIPLIQQRASKYSTEAVTSPDTEKENVPVEIQSPVEGEMKPTTSNIVQYFNTLQEKPELTIPEELRVSDSSTKNNSVEDSNLQVEALRKALMERELQNQRTNIEAMMHQQKLAKELQDKSRKDSLLNNTQEVLNSFTNINRDPYNLNLGYQDPGNYVPKYQLPQDIPWNSL